MILIHLKVNFQLEELNFCRVAPSLALSRWARFQKANTLEGHPTQISYKFPLHTSIHFDEFRSALFLLAPFFSFFLTSSWRKDQKIYHVKNQLLQLFMQCKYPLIFSIKIQEFVNFLMLKMRIRGTNFTEAHSSIPHLVKYAWILSTCQDHAYPLLLHNWFCHSI